MLVRIQHGVLNKTKNYMNNILDKMYQYARWLEKNVLSYETEKNLNQMVELTSEDLEQINRELNEPNTHELES